MVNLVLSSYQKKLGGQLGVMPGTELLKAAKVAEENGIPIQLCDREIRITMRRAWRATSLWKKGYLATSLFASLFDDTKLDEDKLAELRKKDVLSGLMEELGETMPDTKKALIDERDIFMAEKIKDAPGKKIIAVVGAGHVEGIRKEIYKDNSSKMAEINTIPPLAKQWKYIGWSVPAVIILSIIIIGLRQGIDEAGANALFWVLANSIPAAIGAVIAFAHPLTVVCAFVVAPFTSLTPVIGAGYVCAFVQVMSKPPVVKEFESVGGDIGRISGWWQNKLLRVFLVFMLTGFGSFIGNWVGGYRIVTNLFQA